MTEERREQIARVRGMRDVGPQEFEKRQRAWNIISNIFKKYGYRGVEVPVCEEVELHLRKSGESIRQHMYTFEDLGHNDLCLRPEFTASVARFFIDAMGSEKKGTQKFFYCGPSFRHDKPQKGRYREFTQSGVEVINSQGPEHDAEIIALSCEIMEALGIQDYKVVIGSIGIIREMLAKEAIEDKISNTIIEKLEDLGKAEDKNSAIQKIKEQLVNIGIELNDEESIDSSPIDSFSELSIPDVEKVISWVMEKTFGETYAKRDFDEIAKNLIAQLSRAKQAPKIMRVLDFIRKLTDLSGEPEKVISDADKLLDSYGLKKESLENLKMISEYLTFYGIDWDKVKIDFGFGRGLQYYTDMIFEIHCKKLVTNSQVCGGGRYNDLLFDLGAPYSIPALGFSFGLERIVMVMPEENETVSHLDAFIAPMGDENVFRYSLRTLVKMRKSGIKTDMGPKGAKFGKLIGIANKLNSPFTLIIGEDECNENKVSLKNMNTGVQIMMDLKDAIDTIKAKDNNK